MFGGARSTNWRSTSAMVCSSRLKASIRPASRSLKFCDGLMGAAFAGEQIAAIGRGQKILRAALDDPQAMLVQLQVGDDLRVEQAHRVGRDRIAEAGVKFFRHRGAADHLAALDDFYAQSGHREISRAGEAIVPRADDDNVGLSHVRLQEVLIACEVVMTISLRADICTAVSPYAPRACIRRPAGFSPPASAGSKPEFSCRCRCRPPRIRLPFPETG